MTAGIAAILAALAASLPPPATQDVRPGTLTGVVLDAETAQPLSDVSIAIGDRPAIVTDRDGRFEAALPAGVWTVRAVLVGYGLARVDLEIAPGGAHQVEIRLAAGTAPYAEEVTVRPDADAASAADAGTFRLGGGDLLALRGVLADDPFRAVQSAPGVASGDDFRAEFAVRGHGPRQLGFTLDGMDTRLLLHSVRGVADTGSLAIFNTDVLRAVELTAGAPPQRDAGRLGARVSFDLRDGNRDRLAWRASVSGTAASGVVEGPIGAGRRASFLVSLRRSYLDWLLRAIDPEAEETFSFTDGMARLAWQLSPRHTLRMTVIGARSVLRDEEDADGPNDLARGRSATTLANVEWQASVSSRLILTQRLWGALADYRNETVSGAAREDGHDREVVYRVDAVWQPGARVLAEGGLRLGSAAARRGARSLGGDEAIVRLDHDAATRSTGAWGSLTLGAVGAARVTGGMRAEWTEAAGVVTASPWIGATMPLRAGVSLRGALARLHQHPAVDDVPAAGASLRPEEAVGFDAAIGRRAGPWRLAVATYVRTESHGLRDGGDLLVREHAVRRRVAGLQNRLAGDARGIEATLERRGPGGWSGWVSYARSHARLRDDATGEEYDADFDQRHGVTAFVLYRRSTRTSVSARWRAGSNLPLAGYFDRVGDAYYLGTGRNRVRLPVYSRLDVRLDRGFDLGAHRVTLFAEVVNLLGRRNLGPGDPSINVRTGVVRSAAERLFPVLPSAGLLLEW